jgi:hypothetical protein
MNLLLPRWISPWGKAESTLLKVFPVFHDHRVDDLPTNDTTPAEKLFTVAIEFFVCHHSATPLACHGAHLLPV